MSNHHCYSVGVIFGKLHSKSGIDERVNLDNNIMDTLVQLHGHFPFKMQLEMSQYLKFNMPYAYDIRCYWEGLIMRAGIPIENA